MRSGGIIGIGSFIMMLMVLSLLDAGEEGKEKARFTFQKRVEEQVQYRIQDTLIQRVLDSLIARLRKMNIADKGVEFLVWVDYYDGRREQKGGQEVVLLEMDVAVMRNLYNTLLCDMELPAGVRSYYFEYRGYEGMVWMGSRKPEWLVADGSKEVECYDLSMQRAFVLVESGIWKVVRKRQGVQLDFEGSIAPPVWVGW